MTMSGRAIRHMKVPVVYCALLSMFTSCMPIRQAVRVEGPVYPSALLCDDRFLLVGIDLKREKILEKRSRIADPSGKRFAIQVEPHQYDVERKFVALRADVFPCREDGSRIRGWSNGIWKFHFVIEKNGVVQVIDQRWKYWTFYYNPLIHGAPN